MDEQRLADLQIAEAYWREELKRTRAALARATEERDRVIARATEDLKRERLQHLDVLEDIRKILVVLDRYRALAQAPADREQGEES